MIHSLPRAVLAPLASQLSTRLALHPVPAPSPPSSASYVGSSVVVTKSISFLPSWSLGSGVLDFGAISSSSESKSWLSGQRGRRTREHTPSSCPLPAQGWSQGPALLPLLVTHTHPLGLSQVWGGFALCQMGSAGNPLCGSAGQEPWELPGPSAAGQPLSHSSKHRVEPARDTLMFDAWERSAGRAARGKDAPTLPSASTTPWEAQAQPALLAGPVNTTVWLSPVPCGRDSSRERAPVMGRGLQQHRDLGSLRFIPVLARLAWGSYGGVLEFVTQRGPSAYQGQGLGLTGAQGCPTAGGQPHSCSHTTASSTDTDGQGGMAGPALAGTCPAARLSRWKWHGMVSGHGVKWAIELGQGDTFHTHYCDMSSACKVRRGKSEVLVEGSSSGPAAAGLEAGTTLQNRA